MAGPGPVEEGPWLAPPPHLVEALQLEARASKQAEPLEHRCAPHDISVHLSCMEFVRMFLTEV